MHERYGKPSRISTGQDSGIQLFTFGPGGLAKLDTTEAETPERPRDHTVVRMVDEFEITDGSEESKSPFSRNVLLMAYNSEVPGAGKVKDCQTWTALHSVIRQLSIPICPDYLKSGDQVSRSGRRFFFDHTAPETLACLVMEGIAAGGGISWRLNTGKTDSKEVPFPTKFSRETRRLIASEFAALYALMFELAWTENEKQNFSGYTPKTPWERSLAPDATVYVCWYSQLRELFNREPHLARVLKICSLPQKGFRGDWYLRVEPGSVSLRLGKAIVDSLRKTSENFERFREGVGIPVEDAMDTTSLLAWPAADKDLKMGQLEKIWNDAYRRSRITNYPRFNRVLYGIGETLAGKRQHPLDRNGVVNIQYLTDLVGRLPSLVSTMSKGAEVHP